MTCTVAVVIVLALAACVSARKLVNEKVSFHSSVNYSQHKQYDVEPVRRKSLEDISDIAELKQIVADLNPSKSEFVDFVKNLISKRFIESDKPTTVNLLEDDSKRDGNSTTSEHNPENAIHHVTKAFRHEPIEQPSINYTESIKTSTVNPSDHSFTVHYPQDPTRNSSKDDHHEVTIPGNFKSTANSSGHSYTKRYSESAASPKISETSQNPLNIIISSTNLLPGSFGLNSTVFGYPPEEVERNTKDALHLLLWREGTENPDNILKTHNIKLPEHDGTRDRDNILKILSDNITQPIHFYTEHDEVHEATRDPDNLLKVLAENITHPITFPPEQDEVHEISTDPDNVLILPDSITQAITFPTEPDGQYGKSRALEFIPHVSKSEPTRAVSSPQDTVFHEKDTNKFIISPDHLSTHPDESTSGRDIPFQLKEDSDNGSTPSVDILTLYTAKYPFVVPETTLSDGSSSDNADGFSSHPPTDISEKELSPESKHSVDNLTYPTEPGVDSSTSESKLDPGAESYSTQSSLIDHGQDFDSLNKSASPEGHQDTVIDGPKNTHNGHFKDQGLEGVEDEKESSNTSSVEGNILKQDHKVTNEIFDKENQNKIQQKPYNITDIFSHEEPLNLTETNIRKRVKRGELPFVVSLQEKPGHHFCCGSILSSTWIVTAAHCFRPSWRRDAKNLQVMAGSNRLPGIADDIQTLDITYYILHESFLIDDYTNFKDDIAIVKLKSDLLFNDVVGISVLSQDRDWSQEYQVSFGLSSFYHSELLQIKMISPLECESNVGQDLSNAFVCLKDHLECLTEEDSGAPVMVDGLQTGVISFPHKKMIGFLRISTYFSWIQNNTGYVWPNFTPVGGVAEKGDYPFMVILRHKNSEKRCTGVLLTPESVLAPGHCFWQENDTSSYEMLAGLTRLADAYAFTRNISAIKWNKEKNSDVSQPFVILQLEHPLTTNPAIQPITLPDENDEIDLSEPILAIGWQNLLVGESVTQHLHYISLSLLTREKCVNKSGNDVIILCADPTQPLLKGTMGSVVVQNGVVMGVSGEDQSQITMVQPMLKWIKSTIF